MARCLIIGFGYVGQALANRLQEEGHEVYGLCRSAKDTDIPLILKDTQHLVSSDLPEFDYAFYMVSAGEYSEQAYQDAYVNGVRAALNALSNTDLKRFIFISSTGVYPQCEGEWVDETTPIVPTTFSSKALYEGEQAVLNSQLPATVLRFGGIYGPKRTGLIKKVMSGEAKWTDKICYTNRIHLDDCVGICLHVLKGKPQACYNAVDSQPTPMNDVLEFLAKQLDADVSGSYSPKRGHKKCSNKRILKDGYTFKYPDYKTGYLSLLGDFK